VFGRWLHLAIFSRGETQPLSVRQLWFIELLTLQNLFCTNCPHYSKRRATHSNDMSNLAQSSFAGGSSFGPTTGVSLRSRKMNIFYIIGVVVVIIVVAGFLGLHI
jgi:hypothetical protein